MQAAGERTLECWLRQLPALLRLELWDCMCAQTPAAKPGLGRTSLGRPFKGHSKYRCFHSPLPSHAFRICSQTDTILVVFCACLDYAYSEGAGLVLHTFYGFFMAFEAVQGWHLLKYYVG